VAFAFSLRSSRGVSELRGYDETISHRRDQEEGVCYLTEHEYSVSTFSDGLPWDSELDGRYWRGLLLQTFASGTGVLEQGEPYDTCPGH